MAQAARSRKSRQPRRRRGSGGAPWGMLLVGLVSGLVLAALILGAQEGNKQGFGSGLKAWFKLQSTTAKEDVETKPGQVVSPPKPKLDFYTVLPKMERIISDPGLPNDKAEENSGGDARYVLQLASYESFDDADRLKAQLTINGYDAQVQKVTIEEKTYYRVRLGPYQSRRKLKNVKQELAGLGITGGMLLRITDP
jgi:cell division protein FtsN